MVSSATCVYATSVCFSKLQQETILLHKKLCSHVRGQVTCEIVNFNINNLNRKSTKNASHFHHLEMFGYFVLFSAIETAVSYSQRNLPCISFFGTVFE